jgi:GNAT superfamily N-acetyltransferase
LEHRIVLRPAKLADAPAISALAGELGYPTPPSDAGNRLENVLRDSEQVVLVAQAPCGDVVGWIHAFVARRILADPFVDFGGLVVTKGFRGKGIGKKLVEAALTWTYDQGLSSIRVRTNVLRESAHAFYDALGFLRQKSQHVYIKEVDPKRPTASLSRNPSSVVADM